jgi:hypothetical protein
VYLIVFDLRCAGLWVELGIKHPPERNGIKYAHSYTRDGLSMLFHLVSDTFLLLFAANPEPDSNHDGRKL